jgi:hypothetical protein
MQAFSFGVTSMKALGVKRKRVPKKWIQELDSTTDNKKRLSDNQVLSFGYAPN